MKRLAVATFFLLLLSFFFLDQIHNTPFEASPQPNAIITQSTSIDNDLQMVKRGCCSWHKGVCGCKNGRVVCCDGTLSPSCTCDKDDNVFEAGRLSSVLPAEQINLQ